MLDRPADKLDYASDLEERERVSAMTRRKPEAPKQGGTCLNCDKKIAPERRWCDAECRDMWEEVEYGRI